MMSPLVSIMEVTLVENSHGRSSRCTFEYKDYNVNNFGEKTPKKLEAQAIERFLNLNEKQYSWPYRKPVVSQIDDETVNVTYVTESTE